MSANTELLTALWSSHRRLDEATRALTDAQVAGPSYCTDWSTAQVLSHLGSGAQIFELLFEAGLAGAEAPGREEFSKIWDVWNSMSPSEQARQSLIADAAFLRRVEAVPADQLDSLQMSLFGTPADAARLLGLRLAEHAIHTWDVIVIRDPAAEVDGDAGAPMVDGLELIAARTGKTEGGPLEVDITTTDPSRRFRLSVSDAVKLAPSGTSSGAPETRSSTANARMPAAALVRLVYGRLDPEHTPPAVETDGVDLETLRSVFPGV
jgi:uncharacterized protein (TIGR03083 family)